MHVCMEYVYVCVLDGTHALSVAAILKTAWNFCILFSFYTLL